MLPTCCEISTHQEKQNYKQTHITDDISLERRFLRLTWACKKEINDRQLNKRISISFNRNYTLRENKTDKILLLSVTLPAYQLLKVFLSLKSVWLTDVRLFLLSTYVHHNGTLLLFILSGGHYRPLPISVQSSVSRLIFMWHRVKHNS